MEPGKIEYHIGSTIHGQPLRLIRQRQYGTHGKVEWVLCRDMANQRDDSATIAGLTKEAIEMMAEATKGHAQ